MSARNPDAEAMLEAEALALLKQLGYDETIDAEYETTARTAHWGIDEIIAELELGDEQYTLVGRKAVGNGQVWYVGFNLFYLWGLEERTEAIDTLVDYMLAETDVDRALALPALAVNNLHRTPMHVAFDYTSPQDVRALVSMTYFPRWSAMVDGASVPVLNHEHLIALDLPAGTHSVTLRYDHLGTTVARGGWLVTGLSTGATILIAYVLRRKHVASAGDRADYFTDRLPTIVIDQPLPPIERLPCPNCGFRLVEGGNPNDRSYPFSSMTCPICGFSLGEGGFEPGQTLRKEVKEALAAEWLRKKGISDEELRRRYGLTRASLFDDDAPSPPHD